MPGVGYEDPCGVIDEATYPLDIVGKAKDALSRLATIEARYQRYFITISNLTLDGPSYARLRAEVEECRRVERHPYEETLKSAHDAVSVLMLRDLTAQRDGMGPETRDDPEGNYSQKRQAWRAASQPHAPRRAA